MKSPSPPSRTLPVILPRTAKIVEINANVFRYQKSSTNSIDNAKINVKCCIYQLREESKHIPQGQKREGRLLLRRCMQIGQKPLTDAQGPSETVVPRPTFRLSHFDTPKFLKKETRSIAIGHFVSSSISSSTSF